MKAQLLVSLGLWLLAAVYVNALGLVHPPGCKNDPIPGCTCARLVDAPVCGCDGRTYLSDCDAYCQGVTDTVYGVCKQYVEPEARPVPVKPVYKKTWRKCPKSKGEDDGKPGKGYHYGWCNGEGKGKGGRWEDEFNGYQYDDSQIKADETAANKRSDANLVARPISSTNLAVALGLGLAAFAALFN